MLFCEYCKTKFEPAILSHGKASTRFCCPEHSHKYRNEQSTVSFRVGRERKMELLKAASAAGRTISRHVCKLIWGDE